MPFPVDSEAGMVEGEAQSVLGSTVSQLFGLLRAIIHYGYLAAQYIFNLIAEHPEAALIGFANLFILFS